MHQSLILYLPESFLLIYIYQYLLLIRTTYPYTLELTYKYYILELNQTKWSRSLPLSSVPLLSPQSLPSRMSFFLHFPRSELTSQHP